MEWLEQNIDAYRIVSEILGDLRRVIRAQLEAVYGDTWYREGLPEELFARLVAAKERERSIEWYDAEYQQIMDYAVFADLVEIVEKNAGHFPSLVALAPNLALLQARFTELDVMRAKLGRARPISETELSFLGTFHLRFRKAIAETTPPAGTVPPTGARPPQPPAQAVPAATRDDAPPQPTTPSHGAAGRGPAAAAPPPSPPRRPPQTAGSEGTERPQTGTPERTPTKARTTARAEAPPPRRQVVSTGHEEEDAEDAPAPSIEMPQKFVGPEKLAEALDGNDHRTILRELYREVTAIAESVWSSEVTPAPLVWEQVTASDWYEANFSRLGLHPLSVFYEVTSKVEAMARTGATKKEQQELLKETNFAKTLLALRDMFQANQL